MLKDTRNLSAYKEAEALYRALRRPGTGQISDAADLHVSPDGRHAVFSGTLIDTLEGVPPTRICRIDLESRDMRVLTFGPRVDRLPKFSPDGRYIGFLSDRLRVGDYQLYLLDCASGDTEPGPRVKGWVE